MVQPNSFFSYFFFLFFTVPFYGYAQREITAFRSHENIKIDGFLNENAWKEANIATKFVQYEPKSDIPARFDTEVKICYDDRAIYIAAMLYDPHPDSLLNEFTLRDFRNGNHELFSVLFDTYRDGNNGQVFRVTSAGVQVDARFLNGTKEDVAWNMVWQSEVKITPEGWVVEMAIPYAALRFANVAEQVWNVNFFRSIRRYRQESAWNPISPTNPNIVQQCGVLKGIRDIKSPLRLSATPYTAAYVEKISNTNTPLGYNLSAGMDIKYGINDAFTLDMTLVPDFGQVQFDNQVLNLTPFEVRFDENRPFFTEGTELFSKGGLLYSRRIGETTFYSKNTLRKQLAKGESIEKYNPKPQLLNATKISGRTPNGLGLGFFNAIENQDFVNVLDANGQKNRQILSHPLTNYNVLVVDKNLKNSSYITFINTNVQRAGSAYDANVTGTEMNFRNKANTYFWALGGAQHRRRFVDSLDTGYKIHADIGKVKGKWQWTARYNEESTNYNPNDLGFLFAPNERTLSFTSTYGRYVPFGKFNRFSMTTYADYERLYAPNVYANVFCSVNMFWQTRKIFSFGINASGNPFKGKDYFLPQTGNFSTYFETPENFRLNGFISTDYRRPWAWDIGITGGTSSYQQPALSYYFSPRWRANNRLSISFRNQTTWNWKDIGRVSSNTQSIGYESNSLILGWRDRVTIENLLTLKYSVSAKSGFSLRLREYWSSVAYKSFSTLKEDGKTKTVAYAGLDKKTDEKLHDLRYNSFNADFVYTWRFAPGSDVFITYKNNLLGVKNAIDKNYWYDLARLGQQPQTNSFSIKIIYYVDYQNFKK
jgi:Domain of unknown function (DUF5916)